MMTFEERPDKGDNWKKIQNKREQIIDRDLEKANNPHSIYDKDNDEEKLPQQEQLKKDGESSQ